MAQVAGVHLELLVPAAAVVVVGEVEVVAQQAVTEPQQALLVYIGHIRHPLAAVQVAVPMAVLAADTMRAQNEALLVLLAEMVTSA